MSVPSLEREHTPYPRRAGNAVAPWVDGAPFFDRLLEACHDAQESVWAVISFIQPEFRFADGTSWFDLLDDCEARGLDVRVLFWRNPEFFNTRHLFKGDDRARDFLAARGSRWLARWDNSPDAAHCHHQKAFVIDARDPERALGFVGGMVLSTPTIASPGHASGQGKHDVFLELAGPTVEDVAHNFAQRWNEACQREEAPAWPDARSAGDIELGELARPHAAGEVEVQLSRTIRPGLYASCPGGEAGILEQYRRAFDAAQRTIYVQNQHPGERSLLEALDRACARGVEVIQVVPEEPMAAISRHRDLGAASPYHTTFQALDALAARENFTLASLTVTVEDEAGVRYVPIYTHAKVCIVDGEWATVGSANLVDLSLSRDHTELNASFWHAPTALAFLRELINEHTPDIARDAGDVDMLHAAARLAREDARARRAGAPMRGLLQALDIETYARANSH